MRTTAPGSFFAAMAWLRRVVIGEKSGEAGGWVWTACADAVAGETNGFAASNRIRAAAMVFARDLLGMRMLAMLPTRKVTVEPIRTYQVQATRGSVISPTRGRLDRWIGPCWSQRAMLRA